MDFQRLEGGGFERDNHFSINVYYSVDFPGLLLLSKHNFTHYMNNNPVKQRS